MLIILVNLFVWIFYLNRLVFGCSQYFLFTVPSKATPKDNKYSFESMQDEISKASGKVPSDKDKEKMTSDELKCSAELSDILVHLEEANTMSIELDKKVKYTAFCLPSSIRYIN